MLLVEDDDLIRLTTTEMLSDIGCKVKEASTAQEALKILDEQPVDILLTDVGLPGVSVCNSQGTSTRAGPVYA